MSATLPLNSDHSLNPSYLERRFHSCPSYLLSSHSPRLLDRYINHQSRHATAQQLNLVARTQGKRKRNDADLGTGGKEGLRVIDIRGEEKGGGKQSHGLKREPVRLHVPPSLLSSSSSFPPEPPLHTTHRLQVSPIL
jgi:hypothetical protein